MVDNVTPVRRSAIMAAVKAQGGKSTERAFRCLLRKNRISGWRSHVTDVQGKPDFVFRGPRIAVFVDGCFWHGCGTCLRNLSPKSNVEYWRNKIGRNIIRDRNVSSSLRKQGWKIVRVWEHDLRVRSVFCVRRIQKALKTRMGGTK